MFYLDATSKMFHFVLYYLRYHEVDKKNSILILKMQWSVNRHHTTYATNSTKELVNLYRLEDALNLFEFFESINDYRGSIESIEALAANAKMHVATN